MSIAVEVTTPGVTALINQNTVARPISRQPSSTAFLAGYSNWGPKGFPTTITSWPEFCRKFGGFDANSQLAKAVYAFFTFFNGAQAIISRAVGPTPVLATKTLMDGAGSPLATLRVDAKYYSSVVDISVQVAAGTNSNTRKLIFTSAFFGTAATETFDNVTLSNTDLAYINSKSKLVNVTNLNSVTASPTNLPVVLAASALTGGTDDVGNIAAANYVTAINGFNDINLGGGQVACPGITAISVLVALKSHAETYKRLAILDSVQGNDPSTQIAIDDSTYRSNSAALYYPWVLAQKFDGTAGTEYIPPSVAAIGACALVDRSEGIGKAPANIVVPYALDVERNSDGSLMITDAARASLAVKQINVIAPLIGEGIKIYDAQLLYPTGETRLHFVHERRVVNLAYFSLKLGYAWAPFQKVDPQGRFFRDLVRSGKTFLDPLRVDGTLYGDKADDAYVVTADSSNNPPEELAAGRVHVAVGLKISPTAQMVIINIDNVPLTQDLSILNGGN